MSTCKTKKESGLENGDRETWMRINEYQIDFMHETKMKRIMLREWGKKMTMEWDRKCAKIAVRLCEARLPLMGKGVRISNCVCMFFFYSCYLRMCLSESHQIGFMLSVQRRSIDMCVCIYVCRQHVLFANPNNSTPTIGKRDLHKRKPMRKIRTSNPNFIWIDTRRGNVTNTPLYFIINAMCFLKHSLFLFAITYFV